MKTLFFAISLAATFLAMPASAQQGPAGVPGAPGLTSLVPAQSLQTIPQSKLAKRPPKDCSKAKNVESCKAHQQARKVAHASCKGTKGAEHKQCVRDALAAHK